MPDYVILRVSDAGSHTRLPCFEQVNVVDARDKAEAVTHHESSLDESEKGQRYHAIATRDFGQPIRMKQVISWEPVIETPNAPDGTPPLE